MNCFALAACLFGLLAPAAQALDIESMTDAERDVFRAEIREYLLENPEILVEAMRVLEERQALQAAEHDRLLVDQHRSAIFNDEHSWVGGNPDGDVTIVEFLDYRCGYCKRAHPEVEALLNADGNIRIILKELPVLGPESELAARYAMAVKRLEGDERYSDVHDAFMAWAGPLNEGALGRIARSSGVTDHAAVLDEMTSPAVSEALAANRQLAQVLQIRGTPGFIIGDSVARGYVGLSQMQSIVEDIRAERG